MNTAMTPDNVNLSVEDWVKYFWDDYKREIWETSDKMYLKPLQGLFFELIRSIEKARGRDFVLSIISKSTLFILDELSYCDSPDITIKCFNYIWLGDEVNLLGNYEGMSELFLSSILEKKTIHIRKGFCMDNTDPLINTFTVEKR